MHINEKGLNIIKKNEGLRLDAYRDSSGCPTIGYGHTKGVYMGMSISVKQADAFLREDVKIAENAVHRYQKKYNFNENEFSALVSFAFNIGSIKQLTANGTRSRKVISQKMLEYCKCKGKKLRGLENRRKEEQRLFLAPVKSQSILVPMNPPQPSAKYARRYTGSNPSFADALKEYGYASGYSVRKKYAKLNGIVNYSGQPSENIRLFKLYKQGNLRIS